MPRSISGWAVVLLLAGGGGCMLPRHGRQEACAPSCAEEPIRIKAPPQKIVIEQRDCPPAEMPCERCQAGKPESAPQPESAPERKERAPRRESAPLRPEADYLEGRSESALSTLGAIDQIASLTRTTALTSSLGTVSPGASGLGVSIQWIHIPIPFPRLFAVKETPSITVPLNEANIMAFGGQESAMMGRCPPCPPCGGERGLSRQEMAALVARELAAQKPLPQRQPGPSEAEQAERARLERKLADAEAQLERMSNTLRTLDQRLSPSLAPPLAP